MDGEPDKPGPELRHGRLAVSRRTLGLALGVVIVVIALAAIAIGLSSSGPSRHVRTQPVTTSPVGRPGSTTSLSTTANSGNLAYRDLQGKWQFAGNTFTFIPLAGHAGMLTTVQAGGVAAPGATEAVFQGVQAGNGQLIVLYDFARAPNVISVDDGSSTYQAQRSP